MLSITASVGNEGVNKQDDILKVQQIINRNLHLLFPLEKLQETGEINELTISAIEAFQRRVALIISDGKVDPDGKAIKLLNDNARDSSNIARPQFIFPLRFRPTSSYKTGGRQFGARRAGRKHAACDLLAKPGTEILAMEDGEVVGDCYPFYEGTHALEVNHKGLVVRYGEIKGTAPGIQKGSRIAKGEVIAYVGQLTSGASMLHLEMYSGIALGPLTVKLNPPYTRRSDLLDPTDYLDLALLWNESQPLEVGMGCVNRYVETSLALRSAPSSHANPPLDRLPPGAICEVIRAVAGSPYSPADRTDWYEVKYGETKGFVAAYYIDYNSGQTAEPVQRVEHDWYKITKCSQEDKDYLVCMSAENSLCKILVSDTMQDLRSQIDELTQKRPRALTWHAETAVDLTQVPSYAEYYNQEIVLPPPPLASDTDIMARTIYGELKVSQNRENQPSVG